jgi:hypothetical protein
MVALVALALLIQTGPAPTFTPPCRVSAFDALAFYPGTWTVTRRARMPGDRWESTSGQARIEGAMHGCAFIERLDTVRDGAPIQALGVMTFDRAASNWQLTISDSEHGRMQTYEGKHEAGIFVLTTRIETPAGAVAIRRTLSSSSADAFQWELAMSNDQGRTWNVQTVIDYRRRTN